MSESSIHDDPHRRRSQSLYEYRPRVDTQLILNLFSELILSKTSSLPSIVNINSSTISNEILPKGKKHRLFYLCEPIIAGLILFPLLVIFWQSGWNCLIEWLNTSLGEHQATLPTLYIISQIIFLIIYIIQDHIYNFLVKQELNIFVKIILQSYTLIIALNYIIQWVSMWALWDLYTSDDWLLMLIISIASIGALIALTGHSGDLVCSPFIISYDSIEYNIRIGTPFQTEKMNKYLLNILNYIFYEHIVSLLTILAWRGSYAFFDAHIYPSNENLSAVISLGIGYPLFFILMYLQYLQDKFAQLPIFIQLNYPNFLKNFYHLCSFLSCVLLWRGFWILFDTHIATLTFALQSPYLFYIIAMIISFSILSFLKSASSINGPLSHIDDEYNLFPIYTNCFLTKSFSRKTQSNEIDNIKPYTITLF